MMHILASGPCELPRKIGAGADTGIDSRPKTVRLTLCSPENRENSGYFARAHFSHGAHSIQVWQPYAVPQLRNALCRASSTSKLWGRSWSASPPTPPTATATASSLTTSTPAGCCGASSIPSSPGQPAAQFVDRQVADRADLGNAALLLCGLGQRGGTAGAYRPIAPPRLLKPIGPLRAGPGGAGGCAVVARAPLSGQVLVAGLPWRTVRKRHSHHSARPQQGSSRTVLRGGSFCWGKHHSVPRAFGLARRVVKN